MNNEKILILDFGGHFNQLVARKVRECSVYCEVVPSTYNIEQIIKYNPKGIILVGGPNSTELLNNEQLVELDYPILGICHGAKLLEPYNKNNLFLLNEHPSILEEKVGQEKLSDFIGSDFAHLTTTEDRNTIQAEYVCSTAGEED